MGSVSRKSGTPSGCLTAEGIGLIGEDVPPREEERHDDEVDGDGDREGAGAARLAVVAAWSACEPTVVSAALPWARGCAAAAAAADSARTVLGDCARRAAAPVTAAPRPANPAGRRNRHPGRCGEAARVPGECRHGLDIAAVGRRAGEARRPTSSADRGRTRRRRRTRGWPSRIETCASPPLSGAGRRVCRRGDRRPDRCAR